MLCRQVTLYAVYVPKDQHLIYTFPNLASPSSCFSQNVELILDRKKGNLVGSFHLFTDISASHKTQLERKYASSRLISVQFTAKRLTFFRYVWIYGRLKHCLHLLPTEIYSKHKPFPFPFPYLAIFNPAPKGENCQAILVRRCFSFCRRFTL